jgi:GntR family transcriptional regulator/MocR family aminotransferase
LLLPLVYGDRRQPLGRQIEERLRDLVRNGALRPGDALPSTRALAAQLGVSRRLIVDVYAQLRAEGYLAVRQGARPAVSSVPAATAPAGTATVEASSPPLYDLRPSVPDLTGFPRAAWLRSLRGALAAVTDIDLGYGDPRGVYELRAALAAYLARVRGVATSPERIVITSGYTQALNLVCAVLAERGAGAIGLEAPSNPEQAEIARRAGLAPIAVPVDEHGLRVDGLAGTGAAGVVVTPAHQHPTGVVLTAERRAQLVDWLRANDAYAVEDDYDAEYRYDRHAVGALQGLAPDVVVYAGSASKTLAPALRLGWLVLPEELVRPVTAAKELADQGSPRLEQLAFADFLTRGEFDRHLRRMRATYRRRRDALRVALTTHVPDCTITGVAAGLHLTVHLPGIDEPALRDAAARRRVLLGVLSDYFGPPTDLPPSLLLGYARLPEAGAAPAARHLLELTAAARGAVPEDRP